MRIQLNLIQTDAISAEEYLEALFKQQNDRPSLGQLALELGFLTTQQVREILHIQSEGQSRRFGEIAMSLGMIKRTQLAELLMEQLEREKPIQNYLEEICNCSPEEIRACLALQRNTRKPILVYSDDDKNQSNQPKETPELKKQTDRVLC